jgi:hypothetical protein
MTRSVVLSAGPATLIASMGYQVGWRAHRSRQEVWQTIVSNGRLLTDKMLRQDQLIDRFFFLRLGKLVIPQKNREILSVLARFLTRLMSLSLRYTAGTNMLQKTLETRHVAETQTHGTPVLDGQTSHNELSDIPGVTIPGHRLVAALILSLLLWATLIGFITWIF